MSTRHAVASAGRERTPTAWRQSSPEARIAGNITQFPLGQVVVDALREAILAARYKPGARLVEDRLAEDMGVSRVPIREALRVLAAEGLVEIAPRRGATVAALSRDAAREMIEVRATLEGLNARLAARRHSPETAAGLEGVLDTGNRAAAKGDAATLHALNARFHDLLANAGGNAVLGEIMRTLRTRTTPFFATMSRKRAKEIWEEHAAIVRAVIGGDEELAELLANRHVTNAGSHVIGSIEGSKQGAADL
ncbi:MAG: GntR family transcriptional regulator [Burkholderiales bacterium]